VVYDPVPQYDTTNSGAEGKIGPYPFGVDPAWHGAQNELIFMNSLKMKMSVIIGVAQMILGLLLRFANSFHDGSAVNFFFECIPMMVFMLCFFAWMDFQIMYKWVTPMDNPPSIINSMIAMAMRTDDPDRLFADTYPDLSLYLLIACICAIPVLLIPKPVCLWYQHQQQVQAASSANRGHSAQARTVGHVTLSDEEAVDLVGKNEAEAEEFEIGEVVIHQIIETIEYVLGTVSHTASYLRLWALSLAHQQLSVVFFDKTLQGAMEAPFPTNMLQVYFFFIPWFFTTCGILLGMDVLECFLHTLRLHWVEFQSKFYKADGYAFEPFCHRALVEKAE